MDETVSAPSCACNLSFPPPCEICGPRCEHAPRVFVLTATHGPITITRAVNVCALWGAARRARELVGIMEELRTLAIAGAR